VYDPSGTGYVDAEVVRGMLVRFGLSDLTKADMQTLMDMTDRDRDGKVGLSDFRKMVAFTTNKS
jgi:Ca2+-binding EF-hand superfamily protein